ncbi:hypothetical protein GOP47_0017578 [Adiantum capillus-veneris]|uniref:RING-type E3 ubiquitin transferase n=1 Tax=Adiantum capillus-veneris TaxID=13818 RepID=A0A9D4UFW7_ADICA|nr:hypothetical protein GOP47_0017578 [Adiantum capillus-veneris]
MIPRDSSSQAGQGTGGIFEMHFFCRRGSKRAGCLHKSELFILRHSLFTTSLAGMAGTAEQFVDADDMISSPYNDALHPSSLDSPVYWCRTCNIHVVPRGGRVIACPECEGENILPLGNLGSSPTALGLRYRGRQRVASELDLSRLGEGNDNNWHLSRPSLSDVLMGHNASRSNNALIMPTARIPLFGTSGHDWEDVSNQRSLLSNDGHEQDRRLGYQTSVEGRNSPFLIRPWGAHSLPIHTRIPPEPTWQQFMQEMLQSILRRGDRAISVQTYDHVSDPGDYMDDSRGFDRLLSELADNDNDNHGPPPAAKSAVRKLRFIAIEQQHIDDDSATCPVCKDRMELGEMAKELPCQHLYHESCILPWLDFRNSCPVCRFELPTDDPDYEARKHAVTSNTRSMIGQERHEANDTGLQVDGADENMRFYPNLGVEEIQEEFEAHPVEQSRRYEGWRRGWLWLAARPLLSLVGIVLAFTLGHRLIVGQESTGNQLVAEFSSNPAPDIVGDDFYNCP